MSHGIDYYANKHVKLAADDPRRLWPHEERKRLIYCANPNCAVEFFVPRMQAWGWYVLTGKHKHALTCSYRCMKEAERFEAARVKERDRKRGLVNARAVIGIDPNTHSVVSRFDSAAKAEEYYGYTHHSLSVECLLHEKDPFKIVKHANAVIPLMMYETTYRRLKDDGML